MGGNTNLRPIVREAFPTNADVNDEELPRTSGGFGWMEDPLRGWEALSVFGSVLLSAGFLLQTSYGGTPATVGLIVVVLCGFPAVYWGYTELALALFGAGGVVFITSFLSDFPPHTKNLLTYVGIAGALALALGLVLSVRTSMSMPREDEVTAT
jgi:hypothetical protein